jgi:signal transduction histidine kinase/DNA-binding response OmpR family regulator/ligand-binding sensor domain-containing protein
VYIVSFPPKSEPSFAHQLYLLRMKTFLTLLLAISVKFCFPQGFQNLSVKDGLSNSTTFAIIQDQKGLMWFSTKEGIDRYDGSGYKHYNLYTSDKLTRYGLRRNKFHLDQQNQIWVNNFSDVFLYQSGKDKFQFIYSVAAGNTIRDIFVDSYKKYLYLATDQGLIKYNYATKKTVVYEDISAALVGLYPYSADVLVVALKKGIAFFDHKAEKLVFRNQTLRLKAQIENLTLSTVCVDGSKNIFCGSSGQVSTFKLGDYKLKTSAALNKLISNVEVTKILPDKQQAIYFGTEGKGLYKVNANLQILQSFYSDQNNLASLPENEAMDLFIDRDNRVWIAGHEISYLNPTRAKFRSYTHQLNNPNSLIHNSIRSIIEDHKGNLWIGTNYGISILNTDRKNWSYLNTQKVNNTSISNKVTALTSGYNETILAGTYQNGIFSINQNHTISHISKEDSFSFKKNVNTLYLNGDELWFGGAGVYLKRQSLKTGFVKTFSISNVLSISKNEQGEIVTGGHNGLHIINAADSIRTFNASEYKIGSVFCVRADHGSRVWLASEGQGLIRFDTRNGSYKKYLVEDGLPSNLVYGILQDEQDNLWLSTTKGLSCFNKQKQSFRNYSLADGLTIKEFAYGAYAKTSKKELVFGGNHGLVIFNPIDVINNNFNTRLFFTDFKVFNRSANIDIVNTPLIKSIDETSNIKLKYNQNALTFDFVSVNYNNTANLYRWKLDGLDKEWSPATSEHSANYTNLKPGTYTFRVQWTNSGLGSQFSKNERVLNINISSPFWATTWAYLFYTSVICLLIFLAFKFYHIQISELHAKDKIKFFINIAHDIRTPLSLIRSPLSIALKRNDLSDETQEVLKTASHNASRLTSLVDQLLDFEKAEFKNTKLQLSSIHAEETLDKLCNDFIPLLEQRGIILIRNYKNKETLLRVDKDKFDKIIFNILSNAVKYTPKGGSIHIKTGIQNHNFYIKIQDSGVGIPKEEHKHIFKRYFRAKNVTNSNEVGFGIGLMVTRELVKLHSGEIWFDSDTNQGTTFHITLPVINDHFTRQLETQVAETTTEEINYNTKQRGKLPKILITEDNDELRSLMTKNLANFYEIHEANNGCKGLESALKISPDVIISDVMMPDMDGNEFCYEIKNNIKTSHIPFILLTALSTNQHKIESYKTGADTYLEKPFDLDLLRSCIDNLIENRKKLRERFASHNMVVSDGMTELDKKFVEQITKITEANIANADFAIEELEKEVGMSHASLYRKFKGLMGKTPLGFVQHYRLKKAMDLLVNGGHNVNEVAYMVGFSDPKYFSTVFKKHFGKNASEYLREKNNPLG